MKKWIKRLLFVMVVSYMLAFAIVAEQGGSVFFENNWNNMGVYLDSNAPVTERVQIDEKIKLVQIIASRETLVVETAKTEGNEVTVKWADERAMINQPSFNIIKQGEHVVIQVKENLKGGVNLVNLEGSKVLVTIPSSYKGDLDVSTKTGHLELNSTYAQKITVASQTGNVHMLGISTNKAIKLKSNSGEVNLTLLKMENFNLNVATKTGNISLPAVPAVSLVQGQREVACQRGTGDTYISIQTHTGNVQVK